MTKTWVAVVLAAFAVAPAVRAGEVAPSSAPVPAPVAGGCAPAACGAPCAAPCAKPCVARQKSCGRCARHDDRGCCEKLCDWLTYRSHCTPCGTCRGCMDVYPPLYLYFVVPCCKEGCYRVPAACPAPCCNDCHYANLLGPVCPPQGGCAAGGCTAGGAGCK